MLCHKHGWIIHNFSTSISAILTIFHELVATQDWLLSHDQSLAVRRLAAAQWPTHQRPTTNRWPVIVQHKLLADDRSLWPITFDFRSKTDSRQKLLVKKEHLEIWLMLCVKYDFVIIAAYVCTKTFRYENQLWVKKLKKFRRLGRELNGVATDVSLRIFSWRAEQLLLFRSFLHKFISVDLAILTRCIHTHYACLISF